MGSNVLSDIDSALAAPPPDASAAPSPPAPNPVLSDIDNALAGNKPTAKPAPQFNLAKEAGIQAGNVAGGVNTSILAGIPGFPGDVANMGARALGYGEPFAGTAYFNHLLGKVGVGTEAINPDEQRPFAQEVGQGIGSMVGPNVLAKGKAITGIAGPVASGLEDALSAGSVPANAAIGAGSGIVGGAAANVAPEPYKPLAYTLGSLAGGVGSAGVAAAGTAVGRGAASLYNAVPPLTTASREAAATTGAANRFRTAATDPLAAADALDTATPELVPGSAPTTAELSGDVGLLGAQRYREANSPEFGSDVVEQRGANNSARTDFLEGQAPKLATPEDTQAYLHQYLADSDATANQQIETSRQSAGQALPVNQLQPEGQGALARGAVEAERAPQAAALTAGEQNATGALENATGQFGGREALGSPDEAAQGISNIGAAMRDPIAAAQATEQQRLRTLRDSIDPTGTMGMRPDAIKSAVGQIGKMFPAEGGAQLSGTERNLYDTVNQWGDLIPVDRAFQLRANVNGRLRGLQGSDPQEALRLNVLKNGVDEAIAQAASDVQAGEQAGVIHQGMPALADRLAGVENRAEIGPSFAQDVAAAYAASGSPTARRLGQAFSPGADIGNVPVRTGAISDGAGGAGAEGGGRPGGYSGDQGVPQDTGLTPLTPEARNTFAEWNAGYRQMGQTFRGETPGTLHAVGKILQKGGAYDSYRLTDAEVPSLFINRGPNTRQAVDRFLAAAPPEAHGALDDALSFSLRRAAQNPDGTLNLDKYDAWLKQHGATVSARPELMQRFSTAAQAQRRLNDIRDAIAQHAKDHPLNPGWSDSSLLGRFFKPGAEGAESMKQYQRITGNRPEAQMAASDYAAYSFARAAVRDGEVNPRLADAWLRQHEQALSAVPGLKQRFADATTAQRSVEAAIEAHETARSEFTQSVAGAFIQDDPGRAVARVFSGANRQQKAGLLMDLTKGSKAAQEGLQRAAVDYIRSKFEGAPMAGSEAGAMTPKRFAEFVAQNRDVLSTLFPGKIANFDALAKDLERGSLVAGAKVNKGGSDTAELTAGRQGEHHSDIGTAVGAVLAERMGEHVGSHIGAGVLRHVLGPVAAVGSIVGRVVMTKARAALQVREDQLFDRMLMEPSYAREVMRANPAKAAVSRAPIGQTFRGRLVQQMLATS